MSGQNETGDKWGDPISEDRQSMLDDLEERQRTWAEQPEATRGDSPFADSQTHLTGADVFWLAKRALALHLFDPTGDVTTDLAAAEKRLQHHTSLYSLNLSELHLEGADLRSAHLEGATLSLAWLEKALLRGAHLEGAFLGQAQLNDANLTAAWFDKTSQLNEAVLTGVSLDQVTFDNTNLTVVDWSRVDILGDERSARRRRYSLFSPEDGKPKHRKIRLDEYKSAVRANRVLAVALRNQGLNEDADRFAYRAQLLQQQVLRFRRKFGAYVFSRFLDVLAGYGYRPRRAALWYLATVFGFACAYFFIGHTSGVIPGPVDAVVFSLTSFHGRGFFPSEKVSLHSPLIVLAALEAVIGLLIEISFIATFTQRFFGR